MDYERRLAELLRGTTARDVFEITVLQQILAIPAYVRKRAYESAMKYAPPAS